MSGICSSCKDFHPLQTCKEFHTRERQKEVADGLNLAANHQFNAGRYEEALRLYSQAILKDSSDAKYFGNRCTVLMTLRNYDDALYDAKKAIELNKNYSKMYDQAIRCCLIIGEIQGAEEIIKTFKSFHPSDPSLDGNIIKLKKLKELLIVATQSYKIGDFKSCMETIEKCFEISPRYLMMLQLKASCLEARNFLEEALELRNKILITDPRNAEFLRDKGILLNRLGKLHEALQTLEAAARMQPKEDESVKQKRLYIKMLLEKTSLGQNHLITGKLDEAVQIFTEVVSLDPTNSKYNKKLYEFRGEANFHLRYYAAAFVDFSESLKIGEKSSRCLYLRACCHHAMAQFEDCLIDCEASMKIQWDQQTQSLYEDVLNMLKSDTKCPYHILGVPRNASMQEVKIAYQNLTLKYHPSQNSDATDEERMKLEWKFEEIAKAYVKLNNPKPAASPKQEQPRTLATSLPQINKEQMQRVENDLVKIKISKVNKKHSKSKEECSIM